MYSKSCCMQHTVPLPLANTSTMITSFAQFAFHWFESNNLSRWVNLYIYHEPFLISNRQHLWNQSSPLESPGRPFASPASKVNIGDEKTHVQIYLANLDFPEIRGPMSLPKNYLMGAQVVWGRYNLTIYICMICLDAWIDFNISLCILTYFYSICKKK